MGDSTSGAIGHIRPGSSLDPIGTFTLVTALSSARQTNRVLEAATGRALTPTRDMRFMVVCILLYFGLVRDRCSNRHSTGNWCEKAHLPFLRLVGVAMALLGTYFKIGD